MAQVRAARRRVAKAALTVTALVAGVLTVTSSVSANNPVLLVTSTADSGAGSLRSAITTANSAFGADTIHFAIPGCSPCTITLASALPTIAFHPIVIDGFTQDQTLGRPPIIIDGTSFRTNPNLAVLNFVQANNSTIRGLALVGGPVGAFIFSNDFVFEKNWVGTADGTTAKGNSQQGILIRAGGSNNLQNITVRDNVISGNAYGMTVTSFNGVDTVNNVTITGNLIGTTASGTAPLPNGSGLGLDAIRQTATVTGNTIRSNGGYGLAIGSPSTTWIKSTGVALSKNLIQGNALGGIKVFPGNNGDQAAPGIASALTSGVSGTVPGAGAGVKVELFAATCDANGAQGNTFLGDAITGAGGMFAITPSTTLAPGAVVAATATGANGTSTYSACATVTAPVASPIGENDSYEIGSNQQLVVPAPGVLANDTDANGDPLSAMLVTQSANGSVTLNDDGSFVYTPPPDFGGLFVFTYRASDGNLNSNTVTASIDVRPSPPVIQQVSGTLDSQFRAVVSFARIIDPFYGAIEYTATCAADGGATATTTSTSSPIIVSGLSRGPSYRCTVTATNIGGTSPTSAPTEALATAELPGAPIIDPAATVTVDADRSALIVFAPPTSDGGVPLVGYEATCISSNGGATKTSAGMASPIAVVDLSPGKTYTCRATAQNEIGAGQASASTKPFTMPTVPGRPVDVTAAASTTREVSVSFLAPTFVGTSAISQYTLRCISSNGGVAPANVTGSSSPLTMTGLSAGRTYTCTVAARNAAGTGPWSTSSNLFTVLGLPGAPQQVTATVAGTTATVNFDSPAPIIGDPITGYTATCSSSDGGATRSVNGTVSPITVTTLSLGKTYTCSVIAKNQLGNGPAAVSTPFLVPLPGAPRDVTVTMTGSTARVTFVEPAPNGSNPPTGYSANCVSSTGGTSRAATGTTSPISVTALSLGATYTCTVTSRAGTTGGGVSAPTVAFTVANVPSAPGSPAVTLDASGTGAVLRFTPASDRGSPITSYAVICIPPTTPVPLPTRGTSGTRSPLILTGFEPNTTYTCSLRALNVLGNGTAVVFSITAAALPPAPGDVDVEADGNGTGAIVTFVPVPPSTASLPVAWYRVTCAPAAGGTTRSITALSGPVLVTGLVAKTTYNCSVASATIGGRVGAASAPVSITTT